MREAPCPGRCATPGVAGSRATGPLPAAWVSARPSVRGRSGGHTGSLSLATRMLFQGPAVTGDGVWLCPPPAPPRDCHLPGGAVTTQPSWYKDRHSGTECRRLAGLPRRSPARRQQRPGPAPGVCGSWGRVATVAEPAWTRQDHGQQAPTRRPHRAPRSLQPRAAAPGSPGESGTRRRGGAPRGRAPTEEAHAAV